MERGLVACTDIDGLMQTLSINHIPLDWRLCIDSSKLSVKAILLHNSYTLPSFEVILTVHRPYYVEIKCQLDATDDIYCMLNMFRAILCPSSGAREYYTDVLYSNDRTSLNSK